MGGWLLFMAWGWFCVFLVLPPPRCFRSPSLCSDRGLDRLIDKNRCAVAERFGCCLHIGAFSIPAPAGLLSRDMATCAGRLACLNQQLFSLPRLCAVGSCRNGTRKLTIILIMARVVRMIFIDRTSRIADGRVCLPAS